MNLLFINGHPTEVRFMGNQAVSLKAVETGNYQRFSMWDIAENDLYFSRYFEPGFAQFNGKLKEGEEEPFKNHFEFESFCINRILEDHFGDYPVLWLFPSKQKADTYITNFGGDIVESGEVGTLVQLWE